MVIKSNYRQLKACHGSQFSIDEHSQSPKKRLEMLKAEKTQRMFLAEETLFLKVYGH